MLIFTYNLKAKRMKETAIVEIVEIVCFTVMVLAYLYFSHKQKKNEKED